MAKAQGYGLLRVTDTAIEASGGVSIIEDAVVPLVEWFELEKEDVEYIKGLADE